MGFFGFTFFLDKKSNKKIKAEEKGLKIILSAGSQGTRFGLL
jgi:hypothetical protein